MTDDPAHGEPAPEGDDRRRRLEALQRLAQGGAPLTSEPSTPSKSSLTTKLDGAARAPSPRHLVLIAVACALVIAVVTGAVAWLGRDLRHAAPGKTAHPVAPLVMTLPAGTKVYCLSQPAWSPDGKYIAVMARTDQPGGDGWCFPYNDLVSSYASQDLNNGYSDMFTWDTTALILDAKTGALVRQLTPSDPTSALCAGVSHCGGDTVTPVSLAWSPDGGSVLIYTTVQVQLNGPGGQTYAQIRGALEVMRADGTGNPRLLTAFGRKMVITNGAQTENLYSSPLFTWDLNSGGGSFVDFHEQGGVYTMPFAPSYQISASGEVSGLSQAVPNTSSANSIWSYGALYAQTTNAPPSATLLYQGSMWLWSEDGRYVAPGVASSAYMNVDKLTVNGQPNFPGLYNPPFVAPPDAATTAAIRDMARVMHPIYLARSPDGARLASFACDPSGDTGKLTIRATASGATLTTTTYRFPTLSTSFGCPGDAEAINWSPDGSRVAMTDNQDGQVVIWRIPAQA